MRRRIILILAALALVLTLLPACSFDNSSSLKLITRPYIAQYECVEARLGEKDLLNEYDYIKIIFLDKQEMEILYKRKDGERKSEQGSYSVDPVTRELTGELGLLGFKFKEKAIIKNGQFTITKTIGKQELILKFKAE